MLALRLVMLDEDAMVHESFSRRIVSPNRQHRGHGHWYTYEDGGPSGHTATKRAKNMVSHTTAYFILP
jgi:hypothetical protein